MTIVGLISPGAMGASIGAAAVAGGAEVHWAGDGRSEASHRRAARAGLKDAGSLHELAGEAAIILSVCPPHDAASVANHVSSAGFNGIFVDCNAIAPQHAGQLSELFPGRFVDGGIVGGPAWDAASNTCLYLSGPGAADIAGLFSGSPLNTRVIAGDLTAASAMKMVFAAYTKGSTALLAAILGVADSLGVREVLAGQWGDEFTRRTEGQVLGSSGKAWRFAGEMREIAATFEGAGFPGGFHESAAQVFERLEQFKDSPAPDLESLLDALRRHPD